MGGVGRLADLPNLNSFTFHALLHRRSFRITYERPNDFYEDLSRFYSAVTNKHRCNMVQWKEEEGEFLVCHLAAKGILFLSKLAAPYFKFSYIYCSAVRGKVYNIADMLCCRAVALGNKLPRSKHFRNAYGKKTPTQTHMTTYFLSCCSRQ